MLALFLLAHLVADFILQPLWLVRRKRALDGLLIHVGIVVLCMFALMIIEPATQRLWPAMLIIAAIHALADWGKVHHLDRLFGHPIGPFLLDQAIHAATLVIVLGAYLPHELLWQTSPPVLGHVALIGCGYVIAVFAVPIGVMVWLDPSFAHARLAAPARGRCGLLAAVGVTGAFVGSVLILPVTVLSVAALLHTSRAVHPLDQPVGRIAVLFVAVVLGAGLALLP